MNDYKKYLPSKKFVSIVTIIAIILALFFGIKGIIYLFKKGYIFNNKPTKIAVSELIQKDGNSNGIPDWEEYLWGLNPNKNGPENKEFILAKKRTLSDNGDITILDDSKKITDNEMLSREFFATIVSLQQTGNLDDTSIQSISNAIGQKVEATPLPNIYSKNMLKIGDDSEKTKTFYSVDFINLYTKYTNSDMGGELILISQGVSNNDPAALASAATIATAYKSYGKDLMSITVPNSVYSIHLDLANNYEKTGESIEGMSKTIEDPLTGMKALLNYKKYNTAIADDINKLTEILKINN